MIDMTGRRFGRLTVLVYTQNDRQGRARWRCVCSCGKETVVRGEYLRTGHTTSCGCLNRELSGERAISLFTTHGHAPRGAKHPLYWTWRSMIQRCSDTAGPNFAYYSGRGITVCDQWRRDFAAFLSDMGPKPTPQHSLDRIDNDGPYSPENCRWATWKQQRANRRPARPRDHAVHHHQEVAP